MYSILQVFAVKSSAVVMEALPFILLGSLVSSFIHIYVSDEKVMKSVPESRAGQSAEDKQRQRGGNASEG